MNVKTSAKHLTMQTLSYPLVNRPLRSLFGTGVVRNRISERTLARIPVNCTFPVEMEGGARFRLVNDGFDSLANSFYWLGSSSFEAESWTVMSTLARESATFLDIGANSGLFSLATSGLNPNLQVAAFEPIPRVADALRRNVAANPNLNIRVFQVAIADQNGVVEFRVPTQQTLPLGSTSGARSLRGYSTVQVQTATLDTLLEAESFPPIDFMKVDTETTEPAVFRGATAMLGRDKPVIICEVLSGYTEEALHEVLDPFGYMYYWISSRGLVQMQHIAGDPLRKEMNFLFVTPERAEALMAKHNVTSLNRCFYPEAL